MQLKPDAGLFRQQLEVLRASNWLGPRRWWPNFAFRHDPLERVVEILESGWLLSRTEAETNDPEVVDSRSDISWSTAKEWDNYVRLYFRPKTPTFYHVEGFRPQHRIDYNAKQIAPVYLLFDLESILCRNDSQFSSGSLRQENAENVVVSSSGREFQQLDFRSIYHDSYFPKEMDIDRKKLIICRRHAEIIVPNRLDLSNLMGIVCRSQAEYETLYHLLPGNVWNIWKNKVTLNEMNLFNRRWIYVNTAILDSSQIRFTINSCYSNQDGGPFEVKVTITELQTGTDFFWKRDGFYFFDEVLKPQLPAISLVSLTHPEHYRVKLLIDGCLAYANEYHEAGDVEDIPF